MKANQLAILALRLMGIYCLVEGISMLPFFVTATFGGAKGPDFSMAIGGAATLVVISAVGILLIVFSVSWGGKLTPTEASEEKNSPVTFRQVQVFGFALAGILIFANALPQLFNSIFNLLRATSTNPDGFFNTSRSQIEYAIGTIAKAVFGIGLFFGADGFANFWSSLRNFATPKPPQSQ